MHDSLSIDPQIRIEKLTIYGAPDEHGIARTFMTRVDLTSR